MPKKMGMNTKAVEAKERKAATKKAEKDLMDKVKEDASWADDDVKLAKKKKQKVRKIIRRYILDLGLIVMN